MTKIENIILYTISTILLTVLFIPDLFIPDFRAYLDFDIPDCLDWFCTIYLPEIIIILINFILQKLKVENKIILITIKLLIYIFSILLFGLVILILIFYISEYRLMLQENSLFS